MKNYNYFIVILFSLFNLSACSSLEMNGERKPDAIHSDITANPAKTVLVVSFSDWYNGQHPFGDEIFKKLAAKGVRFVVVGDDVAAKDFKKRFGPWFDLKKDLYINSDKFNPGLGRNWTRDFGPHTVTTKEGEKFLVFHALPERDDLGKVEGYEEFKKSISKYTGLKYKSINVIYQGGHVVPLSSGELIVSEDVLEFNPDLSKKDIEKIFLELDVSEVIWVAPLLSEITRHADIFIKELAPGKLLVGEYSGKEIAPVADKVAKMLQAKKFNVIRFSEPQTAMENDFYWLNKKKSIKLLMNEGDNGFFPYTNSLILSNLAIVPQYQSAHERFVEYDKAAVKFFKAQGFEVLSPDMGMVINAAGSVHCSTMEIPLE